MQLFWEEYKHGHDLLIRRRNTSCVSLGGGGGERSSTVLLLFKKGTFLRGRGGGGGGGGREGGRGYPAFPLPPPSVLNSDMHVHQFMSADHAGCLRDVNRYLSRTMLVGILTLRH